MCTGLVRKMPLNYQELIIYWNRILEYNTLNYYCIYPQTQILNRKSEADAAPHCTDLV